MNERKKYIIIGHQCKVIVSLFMHNPSEFFCPYDKEKEIFGQT